MNGRIKMQLQIKLYGYFSPLPRLKNNHDSLKSLMMLSQVLFVAYWKVCLLFIENNFLGS